MATYKSGSWKSLPSPPDAPDWRSKAGELLPELRNGLLGDEIENAVSAMSLWLEIYHLFCHAYEEPRNDDLIRRVYTFADWCIERTQRPRVGAQDDLATCVMICFYEDIPSTEIARLDMPRWFTRSQIVQNESVFRYGLNEKEWRELLALWETRPRHPAKSKKRSR